MNYYNEIDPYCVAWLKNLIKEGLIPNGVVDDRSIRDVCAADLIVFTQCHFFAGLGGWSQALRLAQWPDDKHVWTGSCPCQPFSSAGKRKGEADDRHLWPAFRGLIQDANPATVFGEQVASRDGREWLSRVRTDFQDMGYAVGAADLCAAGVGAPHIRQRLCFVAQGTEHPTCDRGEPWRPEPDRREPTGGRGANESVAYPYSAGREPCSEKVTGDLGTRGIARKSRDGFWATAEWHDGADGKTRRVKPGICLLAHGVPARVAKLRALGNAIVPQVAAEFIASTYG